MSKVLLIAEQRNGELKSATLNAVSFAQAIVKADGGEFAIAVLGKGASAAAGALRAFGASKVITAEHDALNDYIAAPYAKVVADIAAAQGSDCVVATSTTTGKDLLPRVAIRLNAGMSSDSTGYAGGGQFLRAMWAGNAIATVKIETPVRVATVLQTAYAPAQPAGGESPVENFSANVEPSKAKFVRLEGTKSERPELTEASIVVSGGRGIKAQENKNVVESLADALNAAVGWSRAVVDAGWAPNDLQVGQTGKIVAPKLYIAVGISGAIQHLAGMKNSKVIVAINKDPEAPIFSVADYGIVGDLFNVAPELTAKLKG